MHRRFHLGKIDICRSLLTVALCAVATPLLAQGAFRLENGLWYVDGEFQPQTWTVVDGVLRERHDGEVEVLDLEGAFVVPPFGDAHKHGLTGDDFDRDSAAQLGAGVFYVANPNSMLDRTRAARAQAERPETVDVRYSHGGITGPGGHPRQIYDGVAAQMGIEADGMEGQAYYEIADAAELERRWDEITGASPDFLKVMLERSEHHAVRRDDPAWYGKRGLDPRLLPDLVTRAHARGLRVSVHVTSRADFLQAVRGGADEIAHLPLERIEDEDARLAAVAGTRIVTTTLSHRPTDGVADVDALHADNIGLLRRHGARLVLGTDSAASVVEEARNLVRIGAYEGHEVLRLLVRDTPRWIFPERGLGEFVDGAEASFLVVKNDPREALPQPADILHRVKNGHALEAPEEAERSDVANKLMHVVMQRGVAAGIAEYHRLRTEEPERWDFSEPQLNALGYALLNHGRKDDAIAIFRLNTEMYPDSSNTWDSLGEAYLEAGDVERAAKHYRKSLELNPQNQGARDKLREMGRSQ